MPVQYFKVPELFFFPGLSHTLLDIKMLQLLQNCYSKSYWNPTLLWSGIKQSHILLWSRVYLYVHRGQTNLMTYIYYQHPLGNNTFCDIVSVCSQKYQRNAIIELFFLPSLLSFVQYILVIRHMFLKYIRMQTFHLNDYLLWSCQGQH